MKALIISSFAAAALAASALTSPSIAQTQSDQQVQPGTGGASKPGVQGLPGSKSGPTVKSNQGMPAPSAQQRSAVTPQTGQDPGALTGGQNDNAAKAQDESKVPGKPGGKSGPAARTTQ